MAYIVMMTLLCATFFASPLQAQTKVNGKTCVGVWKTVDDETGRTKSHVEIYKSGSKYKAKIVKLLDPKTLEAAGVSSFDQVTCTACPSDRGKGKKMHGLEMIWDMSDEGSKYGGGKIMDPKKGKIYTCTMWLEEGAKGDELKVRGWVGFFYRTQTWYRIK